MDKRQNDYLKFNKITLVRNGQVVVTCMNDLVAEPINKDLVDCIMANDLLGEYIRSSRIEEIDILCRIWESCTAGELTRQECAELFSILLEPLYYHSEEIFREACRQWDSSDTFLFDLLPPHMFCEYEVEERVHEVYQRPDNQLHNAQSLGCYLDFCRYLVNRGYKVNPESVCLVLMERHRVPTVVDMFHDSMATFPMSFRRKISNVLLYYLAVKSSERTYRIGLRPLDYYHLLTAQCGQIVRHGYQWRHETCGKISCDTALDKSTYGPELITHDHLKRILACTYANIRESPRRFPHLRRNPEIFVCPEEVLETIFHPEKCTSFLQLIQAISPWWRKSIQTIMILRQVPGNLVHVLPKELMFSILRELL